MPFGVGDEYPPLGGLKVEKVQVAVVCAWERREDAIRTIAAKKEKAILDNDIGTLLLWLKAGRKDVVGKLVVCPYRREIESWPE